MIRRERVILHMDEEVISNRLAQALSSVGAFVLAAAEWYLYQRRWIS